MRNRGAKPVKRPVEALRARAKRQRVTAGGELQNAPLNNRDPVFRIVVPPAAAGVPAFARPPAAHGGKSAP